jgi:molybdopterin-binding protein
MQLSARNQLKGIVKSVQLGAVNAEVTVELPSGIEIIAIITKQSAEKIDWATAKQSMQLSRPPR